MHLQTPLRASPATPRSPETITLYLAMTSMRRSDFRTSQGLQAPNNNRRQTKLPRVSSGNQEWHPPLRGPTVIRYRQTDPMADWGREGESLDLTNPSVLQV